MRTPFARFTFAIGVSGVVSPGGIGPIGDVSLVMAWHPVAAWSIGVRAELPILSASLVSPRGSAQAGATLLDVEIARVLGRESWRVHPDVALGVGAASLHIVGVTASAADLAPTADVWMAAAMARAGLTVAIASEWRLRADASLGVTLPEAAVDLSGLRVATWGDPFAMAGASIEFVLR
jgi:glucose uptake protein GlcU